MALFGARGKEFIKILLPLGAKRHIITAIIPGGEIRLYLEVFVQKHTRISPLVVIFRILFTLGLAAVVAFIFTRSFKDGALSSEENVEQACMAHGVDVDEFLAKCNDVIADFAID